MSEKPKICIIYTGGTIAMENREGELQVPDDPRAFLGKVAGEAFENRFEYDFERVWLDEERREFLNKDSTNVNPLDWTRIAETIVERIQARPNIYDGVVVAHGTDTMHFTASAVALALGPSLSFPVVFTGAQTIPDIQHGDARVNLYRACEVATQDIAEVVISFGEYVFRGCRAQKKDERKFDAFESPSCPPLAYVTEHIMLAQIAKQRPRGVRKANFNEAFELKADFQPGVVQISLIPGLEPGLLRPLVQSDRCSGLILQSFGAGNVPDDGDFSFEELIRYTTQDLKKPVIITSQFPANATLHSAYATQTKAVRAGAIPTGNMTSSCAVAKFRWVLATVGDTTVGNTREKLERIRDEMSTPYVDEMDLPRTGNGD